MGGGGGEVVGGKLVAVWERKKRKENQKILAILSLSPLLVISSIVTRVCQSLLFPFVLSWETLAWIGWTYVSTAWGIPCPFHRQAMKILPVTRMNVRTIITNKSFFCGHSKIPHKVRRNDWQKLHYWLTENQKRGLWLSMLVFQEGLTFFTIILFFLVDYSQFSFWG